MLSLTEHQLLIEGRLEVLFDKYLIKIHDAILKAHPRRRPAPEDFRDIWTELCVTPDPTPNHQYVDWMTRQFIAHPLSYKEDHFRVAEATGLHNRFKHRLPTQQKDINHFKTYHDLEAFMKAYEKVSDSLTAYGAELFRDVEKHVPHDQIIYNGSDCKVVNIRTYEQSLVFGKHTKWCTAYKNTRQYFDDYTYFSTPLFVFIYSSGVRYQLHSYHLDIAFDYIGEDISEVVAAVQFMDINDWDSRHLLGKLLRMPPAKAVVQKFPSIGFILAIFGENRELARQAASAARLDLHELVADIQDQVEDAERRNIARYGNEALSRNSSAPYYSMSVIDWILKNLS